ncbi:MAG: hypothetical protein A3C53_00160 [Omnitrophica WOR_2 bacterium RIFCSPHIGHO2_02_FULL_68_15]|nr:MAG: hypothetical protein A3C53_00160 [Omnitrophica WOR_2 bacterium RIFCSPHIGHO2_02_FULL_68_15]
MSPTPSASRTPIPIADLMRASSPPPASVTPRCRGYGGCPRSASVATSRRLACSITVGFDAFIEKMMSR